MMLIFFLLFLAALFLVGLAALLFMFVYGSWQLYRLSSNLERTVRTARR